MNALTISIPPRIGALALSGNLPELPFRPTAASIMYGAKICGITIPVFPLDGDTSRLMDGNGAFLVDGNGDTLIW